MYTLKPEKSFFDPLCLCCHENLHQTTAYAGLGYRDFVLFLFLRCSSATAVVHHHSARRNKKQERVRCTNHITNGTYTDTGIHVTHSSRFFTFDTTAVSAIHLIILGAFFVVYSFYNRSHVSLTLGPDVSSFQAAKHE